MAQWLKQSTAATVKIGPFVDDTDGKTAETGLTISQADVRLSKNGGNMAQKNDAAACTHDEIGWYDCPLNTTDTGTLGRLVLMVHESGALPVWHEYLVLPANVYDSLVSGSDYLQADAVQVEGSDATDQINAACDTAFTDYDPPTKAELDAGLAALNDLSTAQVNAEVDTALADYDPPTKAELDAGLAALNDLSAAQVNAEMDTALADYDPPTKAELDAGLVALNDLSAAQVNAELDTALADYDPPTKAELDAGLAALNDLSAAQVNAELDTALAGYDPPTKAELDAGLAALNDLSAAQVNAELDTALAGYDPPTKAELDAGLAALNDLSAAQVNAELDTALADYDPPTHAEMTAAIATIGAGGGAITFTYTLTSDVDASPIPDARVWVTSDAGGTTTIASGRTDASGQVTFYLDAGTVYVWRQKAGWNFSNPDTESVS